MRNGDGEVPGRGGAWPAAGSGACGAATVLDAGLSSCWAAIQLVPISLGAPINSVPG